APGAGIDEILRQMAATMACHAAVKANDPLTREKMQYLLDELRRTAHSSVCPHGRPVVLRLTRPKSRRTSSGSRRIRNAPLPVCSSDRGRAGSMMLDWKAYRDQIRSDFADVGRASRATIAGYRQ